MTILSALVVLAMALRAFAAGDVVSVEPRSLTCAQARAILDAGDVLEIRYNLFERDFFAAKPELCRCGSSVAAPMAVRGVRCDFGYSCPLYYSQCDGSF